jgi:hypothetical protein
MFQIRLFEQRIMGHVEADVVDLLDKVIYRTVLTGECTRRPDSGEPRKSCHARVFKEGPAVS